MGANTVGDQRHEAPAADGISPPNHIQITAGSFEMLTPAGFVRDEGMVNSLAIMGRALSRWSYIKKMAWLMPRMNRAVPYLGYIAISGVKPINGKDAEVPHAGSTAH